MIFPVDLDLADGVARDLFAFGGDGHNFRARPLNLVARLRHLVYGGDAFGRLLRGAGIDALDLGHEPRGEPSGTANSMPCGIRSDEYFACPLDFCGPSRRVGACRSPAALPLADNYNSVQPRLPPFIFLAASSTALRTPT